jgi:predicted anti-sigma-YlaC factor YlaD
MTCETFRDCAFDFLQGTLRDAAEFEAHRLSCPACAATLDGIRENERLLSAARVPTAPPDLWPRIAAAIGRDRTVLTRGRRWAMALAAAALLLGIGIIASIGAPRPRPRLNLLVQEVGPESLRTFKALVPRYEDVDAATAMVDTMFRSDY